MRWRTISIHAPRTGSDRHTKNTQPARNISIHAPRTGSDAQRHIQIGVHNLISIHAPRTGSDVPENRRTQHEYHISIHAPRTGSDQGASSRPSTSLSFQSTLPARGATIKQGHTPGKERFQSTLPARGATPVTQAGLPGRRNFNPRSPHGERRRHHALLTGEHCISIHAPRTGSDPNYIVKFLTIHISIHAPRTGSD